jgi:lysophospholipase L1-like esterase
MIKAKFEEDTLKALDIHVIDMTKTPAITRYNIDTALLDGLHPTADCHEVLAKEIARRMALA